MNIDWSKARSPEDVSSERLKLAHDLWKAERLERVNAIVVEVNGLRFDGDEESQNRMARAVAAADRLLDAVEWTLADNTVAVVTVQELKAACRLAGEAQTAIWNEGRPA